MNEQENGGHLSDIVLHTNIKKSINYILNKIDKDNFKKRCDCKSYFYLFQPFFQCSPDTMQ